MENFINYFDKIRKVLDSIHFGLIAEIAVNLIVLVLLSKAVDILDSRMKKKCSASDNTQMIKFIPIITRTIKSIIFFIIIAAFLQNHGYSISSLIAGFGITGLAVGFAANSTIANVFGSLAIISDKSFDIGDYIKVGTLEGTVEEINLRATKIRTLDNALTIIPNSIVAGGEIVNISRAHKRRIFEAFGINYYTSNEKLKRAIEILEEILKNNKDIYDDYIVYLDTFGESAIKIKMNAYVKTNEYPKFLKIKEKVLFEAIKQFREEGIEFAFPSTTVYMANEN